MDEKERSYPLRKRAGDCLKELGSLRDGFLVTAALFYFFGYIVWAINAYRNDLGLLPALEFQYFIAGALPVVIILLLYSIVAGSKWVTKKVREWIGPNPTGAKLSLCLVMFVLGLTAWALILIASTEWFKAVFSNALQNWLVMISVVIVVVSSLFVAPLEAVMTNVGIVILLLRLYAYLYVGLVLAAVAVLAFIYCVELYPKIPQEFGGARPYYACLDLVKAQMSTETIEGLLSIDANKSPEPVMRSVRLEVLFAGSDMILVRSRGKVYKIARNTIQAVAMCDQSEGKAPGSPP
jgi:hypothetical protein